MRRYPSRGFIIRRDSDLSLRIFGLINEGGHAIARFEGNSVAVERA